MARLEQPDRLLTVQSKMNRGRKRMALGASIVRSRTAMRNRDVWAWRRLDLWVKSVFIKSGGAQVREGVRANRGLKVIPYFFFAPCSLLGGEAVNPKAQIKRGQDAARSPCTYWRVLGVKAEVSDANQRTVCLQPLRQHHIGGARGRLIMPRTGNVSL